MREFFHTGDEIFPEFAADLEVVSLVGKLFFNIIGIEDIFKVEIETLEFEKFVNHFMHQVDLVLPSFNFGADLLDETGGKNGYN